MSPVFPRALFRSSTRLAGAFTLCAATVVGLSACTMPDRVDAGTTDSQAGWPGIVPVEDRQTMLDGEQGTNSIGLSWKIGGD